MEKWKKIKVDRKVKPIHYSNRKAVELTIGNEYYVSFGMNQARRCILTKIDNNPECITVEYPVKLRTKKETIDGTNTAYWYSSHTLFPDEIGLTPEEAVINQVTS